jgi:ferritin-like metal-binding protein YciE
MEEIEDEMVRDAAIIGSAQAIEHYEITRYGTLAEWARQIGYDRAAELLEETLEEEKQTDALLTELAQTINERAEEQSKEDNDEEEKSERVARSQPRSKGRRVKA